LSSDNNNLSVNIIFFLIFLPSLLTLISVLEEHFSLHNSLIVVLDNALVLRYERVELHSSLRIFDLACATPREASVLEAFEDLPRGLHQVHVGFQGAADCRLGRLSGA
jgi:hypothetical protein